jgi:hypothetical protein
MFSGFKSILDFPDVLGWHVTLIAAGPRSLKKGRNLITFGNGCNASPIYWNVYR